MSMILGTDGKQIDLAQARATVTMVDGQQFGDLRLMPGDYIKMERHFDVSAGEMKERGRMEWVAYMLWMSAKRKHGYALDFDTWVETIENIDFTSGPAPSPGEPAP